MLLRYIMLVIESPTILLLSISEQRRRERQNIRRDRQERQQDLGGCSQNY